MISVRNLLEVSLLKEVNSGPATQEKLDFHKGEEKNESQQQANASTVTATNAGPEAATKGPAVSEALKFHKFENPKVSVKDSASKELGVTPKGGQEGEIGK